MKRLLIAAAALILAGCTSADASGGPVPEGGWTDSELSERVFIADKAVGFPCTLNEIREGFEVEDASSELGDAVKNTYYLKIGGNSIGMVSDHDEDGKVDSVSLLGTAMQKDSPLSINGIGLGSTEKEVSEKLGSEISHFDVNGEEVFKLTLRCGDLNLTVSGNKTDGVKVIQIAGE